MFEAQTLMREVPNLEVCDATGDAISTIAQLKKTSNIFMPDALF
jgi:hypothetical protein